MREREEFVFTHFPLFCFAKLDHRVNTGTGGCCGFIGCGCVFDEGYGREDQEVRLDDSQLAFIFIIITLVGEYFLHDIFQWVWAAFWIVLFFIIANPFNKSEKHLKKMAEKTKKRNENRDNWSHMK